MQARSFIAIIFAVIVAWFAANNAPPSLAVAAQGTQPRKWEYTTIVMKVEDLEGINKLGDAGWEACCVAFHASDGAHIVLKRPK